MTTPSPPAGGVAAVILAHADPEHASRLTHALAPLRTYLHVDSATPAPVAERFEDGMAPTTTLVRPRLRTGWARWENVAAELDAMQLALADGATHVAVLTGSDYPLAPPAAIERALQPFAGRSIFPVRTLPYGEWGRSGGLSRFRYRHWPVGKRMVRLPVPRRRPAGLVPAGGPQVKVVAAHHARRLLDLRDRRPDLLRYWRRVWIADETFVPSCVASYGVAGPEMAELVPRSSWYTDWAGGGVKSPRWLGPEDSARLREAVERSWGAASAEGGPPLLFARKFSTERSSALLDGIDRWSEVVA